MLHLPVNNIVQGRKFFAGLKILTIRGKRLKATLNQSTKMHRSFGFRNRWSLRGRFLTALSVE